MINNEELKPIKIPEDKKETDMEIKIDQILLENRHLFLYDEVTDESVLKLIKQIRALDCIFNKDGQKENIILEICSGGSSCMAGFALINTFRQVETPIVTIINGEACSMAGLIAMAGTRRIILKNSWWMGHDMSGGISGDYSKKVESRAAWIKKSWSELEKHLRFYSKLNDKDIAQIRNGELWLSPKECYQKGIVDFYVDDNNKTIGNNKLLLKPKDEKIKVEVKSNEQI